MTLVEHCRKKWLLDGRETQIAREAWVEAQMDMRERAARAAHNHVGVCDVAHDIEANIRALLVE